MATFLSDTITDIEVQEDRGAIIRLVRSAIVTDLAGPPAGRLVEAAGAAGFPAVNTPPSGYGMDGLRLLKRTIKINPLDNTKADVLLEYGPYHEMNLVWQVDSSSGQIQTERDAAGNPLTVSYTYPADYVIPQYAGQTLTTGASASVMSSEATMRGEARVLTDFPYTITSLFNNAVNAFPFNGGLARTWLCTHCGAQLLDQGTRPRTWLFSFVLQWRPFGWDQHYWFVDPNTGKPPSDLVYGTGIKPLTWYPELHFGAYFANM